MPTLYPPVVTALPQAADASAQSDAFITTPDAYGITPEQYWLGQIADQIILAYKSGKKFVDVPIYMVTANNLTALTGAGYTATPNTADPTNTQPVVNPNQIRFSWA